LTSGFFHGSSSPEPLIIPLAPFRKFSTIFEDIRSSTCLTGINDTGGKLTTGVNSGKFTASVNYSDGHIFFL
jgi:hypothetical protein